ncbi:MAG: hypothetical protein ACRDVG_04695, partial [Jatrophihabitantaceae bacterium]
MPAAPYEPRHAASLGSADPAAATAAEPVPTPAPAPSDDSATASSVKAARVAELFGRPQRMRMLAIGAIG